MPPGGLPELSPSQARSSGVQGDPYPDFRLFLSIPGRDRPTGTPCHTGYFRFFSSRWLALLRRQAIASVGEVLVWIRPRARRSSLFNHHPDLTRWLCSGGFSHRWSRWLAFVQGRDSSGYVRRWRYSLPFIPARFGRCNKTSFDFIDSLF